MNIGTIPRFNTGKKLDIRLVFQCLHFILLFIYFYIMSCDTKEKYLNCVSRPGSRGSCSSIPAISLIGRGKGMRKKNHLIVADVSENF